MCLWTALVLMLTVFHHHEKENFGLAMFPMRKNACNGSKQATFIFHHKKAHKTKSFCFRIMKNCQLQHKGNPHKQEKSQGAAISMEDATTYSVRTSEIETSGLCT
jgi:hypothetical protein